MVRNGPHNLGREQPPEKELLERLRLGEERAFTEFFETYAVRLESFAARRSGLNAAEIEDVVQQTMIQAVRNLGSFRGDAQIFTWLCQICRHVLADGRRQSTRRPVEEKLDNLVDGSVGGVPEALIALHDPLDEIERDGIRIDVRRAINQLPARFVHVLELRFGDELSVPEMARLLGLSTDAAESLLARAKEAFRKRWDQLHSDDIVNPEADTAGPR